MQVSELGNLSLGADIPDDVRARAEAQWAVLETAAPRRTGTMEMGPINVSARNFTATTLKVAALRKGVRPVVNTSTAPRTASDAVAVNENARNDKERKQFVEDLIKASDNTIYDMIKAVAQQAKVGSVEFAMVRGYAAEIAAEARRRFGDIKAKQLLDAAYIKAAPTSAMTPATTTTNVTDPLAPATTTGGSQPVDVERGMTIAPQDERRLTAGFLNQYGLAIGVGAAALLGIGWFLLRQKRATVPML